MLKTLYILRTRWQEVLLIVGLEGVAAFAAGEVLHKAQDAKIAAEQLLPFAVLSVIFWIIAKMLAIGFARTNFADTALHYEPWPLLKIGRHYFWRIIGVEVIVWIIGTGIGIGLCFVIMQAGVNLENLSKETANVIILSCAGVGILLAAKPMLFGPAAIIVTDCGVFGAFGWLSWLRLRHAKILLAAYVFWIAAKLGARLLIENTIAIVAFSLTEGFLMLIIYVKAVKTVGNVYIQTHHREDGFGDEPQSDSTENQGGPA